MLVPIASGTRMRLDKVEPGHIVAAYQGEGGGVVGLVALDENDNRAFLILAGENAGVLTQLQYHSTAIDFGLPEVRVDPEVRPNPLLRSRFYLILDDDGKPAFFSPSEQGHPFHSTIVSLTGRAWTGRRDPAAPTFGMWELGVTYEGDFFALARAPSPTT